MFRILLCINCCGESAFKHINQGSFVLNGSRISGYFDTKFTVVALIEPILHKIEDLYIFSLIYLGPLWCFGTSYHTPFLIPSITISYCLDPYEDNLERKSILFAEWLRLKSGGPGRLTIKATTPGQISSLQYNAVSLPFTFALNHHKHIVLYRDGPLCLSLYKTQGSPIFKGPYPCVVA